MKNFEENASLRAYIRLQEQIAEAYHEIAVRQGLSDSAQMILFALWELGEGCTQKDICGYTYLNKQTVNSSVHRMEENGYICFQPGVGREVRILLTDGGRALLEEKVLPIVRAESAVFDSMTDGERQELLRLTRLYLDRFRAGTAQIR
ncbi:MAG: MarR family transcriptional regulator [Clostridia bacterium]|nr:MarR family transcriptional regulator [Clostridia bacterium]